MLNTLRFGRPGAAPPLIIAHGLFGSARNWGAIARALADRGEVIAVDMRNHGESLHHPDHSYPALAGDLAEVVAAAATDSGGPVDLLGHSMGGKAAMMLALTRPEGLRRLVVADIAPIAYGHSQQGLIAAMRGLDLAGLSSRAEADRRLAERIDDPGLRGFLLQSLELRAKPPRWRLNLDALEANMDGIIGWPAPQGRFDGPTLFLAGGSSDYVRLEHRKPIREAFPKARIARIPEAGHWFHADRPEATAATLRTFLDA